MHAHVYLCESLAVVSACVFLLMCEKVTGWAVSQASESERGDNLRDFCMQPRGSNGRSDGGEGGNLMEVRRWDGDPEGQMPGDSNGGVWGGVTVRLCCVVSRIDR